MSWYLVAMAVMVASFRQSVDDWLVAVLPSDLYLHLEGAEAGGLDPQAQARLAAVRTPPSCFWRAIDTNSTTKNSAVAPSQITLRPAS